MRCRAIVWIGVGPRNQRQGESAGGLIAECAPGVLICGFEPISAILTRPARFGEIEGGAQMRD